MTTSFEASEKRTMAREEVSSPMVEGGLRSSEVTTATEPPPLYFLETATSSSTSSSTPMQTPMQTSTTTSLTTPPTPTTTTTMQQTRTTMELSTLDTADEHYESVLVCEDIPEHVQSPSLFFTSSPTTTMSRREAPQPRRRPPPPPTEDQFEKVSVLGVGSFGRVVLSKYENRHYAVKRIAASKLTAAKHYERTKTERDVLIDLTGHPHIVELYFAYRTATHFALVFEYCPGGELFHHLSKRKYFASDVVAFYIAELALALAFAHSRGVVYRDVKPENCLLDARGHLKLADFGLAKRNVFDHYDGATSVCGTLEYIAPEILKKKNRGYGTAVDYWSLGVLTFELLCGRTPWHSKNKKKLFHDIKKAPLKIPSRVKSNEAALFCAQLIRRDPELRLHTLEHVKKHAFFASNNVSLDTVSDANEPPIQPCKPKRLCFFWNVGGFDQAYWYNFDLKFSTLPVRDHADELVLPPDVPDPRNDPGWDFAR